MDQNIINFIIKKVIIPLYLSYRLYNIIKSIKQQKSNIISFTKLFQPIVFLFLVFSYTHYFNYDILDEVMIFIAFPILFLIESVLFFKNKADWTAKEKIIYITILSSFIITELLYVFKLKNINPTIFSK
ncbi:hypothetical protein [Tissierella praeacuta]|uniref:Uncharacterized protein n=1 Tax=Tissierella praeacuta DSM 18095 TaxID=1123404 RepID=A0A1M4XHR8_9FIRM|nr:hypothetical protein [Tissierella praeacuta]MBU5255312.1 hypothetical protein [Tissierella praeacuta]TCU67822.1 hypothetical protein EV204_11166 [Tissierella praeacuta]SHE93049.1 hypothetical protein SAMN02745784_02265 [Tissierella praeacuta DSM 18095]SUP02106.1 Uncharacterised protein [Tissierella praeacuta]